MEHFHWLFEVVSGVPAHFVFNMGEMGHQDSADRRIKTCYVSSKVKENQVYVPVSRAGKRITLVACIAANGSSLKPMIVIPRNTVNRDQFLLGWTDEKVVIRHQLNGFIKNEIFDAWMAEIFLPELAKRGERYQDQGPAVLLPDNCSEHAGETFETPCEPINHSIPDQPALNSLKSNFFIIVDRIFNCKMAVQPICRRTAHKSTDFIKNRFWMNLEF
jgi:hypothetical protein